MSLNNLIQCMVSSTWGAKATTLYTAALAIVFSAAEYAAPAWERSTEAGCVAK